MIVRCGSINKAASSLFLSQPALTQQLQTLEAELQTILIERKQGCRQIRLTTAGEQFYQYALSLEALLAEGKNLVLSNNTIELSIAGVESFNSYFMPGLYYQMFQENPHIKIKILTHKTYNIYQKIINQEADIGFVNRKISSKSVHIAPIYREKMYFVCDRNAPYPHTKIHPKDIDPSKEIFLSWSDEYLSWHNQWFDSFSTPHIHTDKMIYIQQFLANTDHWSIVPASIINVLNQENCLRICELEIPAPDRICYMLTKNINHMHNHQSLDFFRVQLHQYLNSNPLIEPITDI